MDRSMSISDVARACGVSVDTIRWYEKQGVLAPAQRARNGYRVYSADAVERVRVVRRAIAVGFSVAELARIFRQRAAGKPPCREVRALAARKLDELGARIGELTALRAQLAALVEDWDARLSATAEGEPAHLLDGLSAVSSRLSGEPAQTPLRAESRQLRAGDERTNK